MSIIILLLFLSLLVAVFFLFTFIWNVKSGQYEDDYSPAHRIFYEDKIDNKANKESTNSKKQSKHV